MTLDLLVFTDNPSNDVRFKYPEKGYVSHGTESDNSSKRAARFITPAFDGRHGNRTGVQYISRWLGGTPRHVYARTLQHFPNSIVRPSYTWSFHVSLSL